MFKKRMANQDSWCSSYTTRSSPTQYHPNEVILCLPLTHTASRPNRAPQISSCRRKTRSVNFTHHPHPNCSYPITNLPVRPVPGPKSTSELGIFLHCIAKRLHQPSTPMAGKRPFRERENMLSQLNGKAGKSSTQKCRSMGCISFQVKKRNTYSFGCIPNSGVVSILSVDLESIVILFIFLFALTFFCTKEPTKKHGKTESLSLSFPHSGED